jgi:hypothetical protein
MICNAFFYFSFSFFFLAFLGTEFRALLLLGKSSTAYNVFLVWTFLSNLHCTNVLTSETPCQGQVVSVLTDSMPLFPTSLGACLPGCLMPFSPQCLPPLPAALSPGWSAAGSVHPCNVRAHRSASEALPKPLADWRRYTGQFQGSARDMPCTPACGSCFTSIRKSGSWGTAPGWGRKLVAHPHSRAREPAVTQAASRNTCVESPFGVATVCPFAHTHTPLW